jgi:hypothetical protein
MERTHFGQHGEDCFGCKVRSVSIGQPSDMPTRNPQAVADKRYWTQREKDTAAYKRMRKEGLEVKGTVNAARLEATARTEFELVSGQVAPTASLSRQIQEATVEVSERMAVHEKEVAASK